MFGNNGKCSSGAFNRGVDAILAAAAKERADAEHVSIYRDTSAKLRIESKAPNAGKMAKDLIWIISETLDGFEGLGVSR